jgi:hypothetical protein
MKSGILGNLAKLLVWLSTNHVKVLESDIPFEDPDAIFKMISVSNSQSLTLYTLEVENYILNRILPRDLTKENLDPDQAI